MDILDFLIFGLLLLVYTGLALLVIWKYTGLAPWDLKDFKFVKIWASRYASGIAIEGENKKRSTKVTKDQLEARKIVFAEFRQGISNMTDGKITLKGVSDEKFVALMSDKAFLHGFEVTAVAIVRIRDFVMDKLKDFKAPDITGTRKKTNTGSW